MLTFQIRKRSMGPGLRRDDGLKRLQRELTQSNYMKEKFLFHVVLVEPEIPPNTGNVIRLCANTGAQLHLVEPLGFPLDDAKMRRAGLDYHDYANMKVHKNWDAFLLDAKPDPARMFAMTTHGSSPFAEAAFKPGDFFVFGAESRGLDPALRESFPPAQRIRLPMRPGNRSLNLSNTVAVVVYEAWRQNSYGGGT
jgi:tRNA (cytidine/uridine-2'-O-)-methyltransferase